MINNIQCEQEYSEAVFPIQLLVGATVIQPLSEGNLTVSLHFNVLTYPLTQQSLF